MKNHNGSQLSGLTYVRAKLRSDSPAHQNWHPLILRAPTRCAHGGAGYEDHEMPTICTSCAESWSWDWDLACNRTAAGRRLAQDLGLDPLTAGQVLRYRDGYEQQNSQ